MLKRTFFFLLFVFFLTLGVLGQPATTLASGSSASKFDSSTHSFYYGPDGTLYITTNEKAASQTNLVQTVNSTGNPIELPTGFANDIGSFITAVLSAVMVIAALLVLFNLILGAFAWITSGGDKGKIDQARDRMVAAIIGIIIVAASWAILTLALNFLGFDGLNDLFKSVKVIN